MRFSRSAAVLAAAAPFVAAQTSTDCDPTKKSGCPQDTGLNAQAFEADFASQGSSANSSFSAAAYTFIDYGSNGAEFTISKEGQAPTVQTDFYIFFGRIDVTMRAAPGTGIVSSIVFESDDLDEIDWEFLGGDTGHVETNFFGKGNTTAYDRAVYYEVSNPQDNFHTYTVDWNSDRIEWIIDGVTVRTLEYTDPLTVGGQNYPQSPMRLKLGNWCGGCSGEPDGTIEWAGGNTTFNDAPYTMYVKSVSIQNYNPADSYEYSDLTGSWESIKIIKDGNSANPTGSGTSVAPTGSATAVASGSPSGSANGTVAAPTKSVSVTAIQNTAAAVSTTITGSSYSMNSASASAQNGGSVVSASTEVPGSSATGAAGGSGTASSSGGAAQQTGSSGAASLGVFSVVSLLSVALGFMML